MVRLSRRGGAGSGVVEKLHREGAVSDGSAGAERGGDERRLGDLLARRPRLLRVAGMDVEAVRALRGAGDGERDQLAILARDLAVVAPDDAVQLDEPLELRRRQPLELADDLEVIRIVVVTHGRDLLSARCATL